MVVALLAGCAYAPPKPWEKGELAKPTMQFDADQLEAKYQEHVYQSKEAASGGYRRRRRRLWLQLKDAIPPRRPAAASPGGGAPSGRPVGRARALMAAALALPGVAPSAHAAVDPRRGRRSRCATSTTATGSRGADRMTRQEPVVLRDEAVRRQLGRRGRASSTTACRARRRVTTTRCRARRAKASRTTAPRATRSSRATSTATRSASASRARPSATTCRRPRSLDVRWWTEDRNTTLAFSFAGTVGPHQLEQPDRRQREEAHARFPGRHHAGDQRECDRPVEPDVLARARLLRRPVQVARRPARPPAHRRVAHALEPVVPRARRDAQARVPRAARFVRLDLAHDRGAVGAGAAARLRRRAGPALLHAERRRFLPQPAVPDRLRVRRAVLGRHAALRVRRVHAVARRSRRPSPTGGARTCASTSTARRARGGWAATAARTSCRSRRAGSRAASSKTF